MGYFFLGGCTFGFMLLLYAYITNRTSSRFVCNIRHEGGNHPQLGYIEDFLLNSDEVHVQRYGICLKSKHHEGIEYDYGLRVMVGWDRQVMQHMNIHDIVNVLTYGCVMSSGLRIAVLGNSRMKDELDPTPKRHAMVDVVNELRHCELLKESDEITIYFTYTVVDGIKFTTVETI